MLSTVIVIKFSRIPKKSIDSYYLLLYTINYYGLLMGTRRTILIDYHTHSAGPDTISVLTLMARDFFEVNYKYTRRGFRCRVIRYIHPYSVYYDL